LDEATMLFLGSETDIREDRRRVPVSAMIFRP
jgi:hypothetical protein